MSTGSVDLCVSVYVCVFCAHMCVGADMQISL